MLDAMNLLNEFGSKCTFAVSIQLLLAMTVMKMLTVTQNKKFSMSCMWRVCFGVWCLNIIVYGVGLALHYWDTSLWDFAGLWLPFLTYSTIVISVCCFCRIYYVLRRSNRSLEVRKDRTCTFSSETSEPYCVTSRPVPPPCSSPRRKVGDTFTMIATIQLSAFIVCVTPLVTYQALCNDETNDLDTTLPVRLMRFLLLGNPVCNSISFFVVYRHLWRRNSQEKKRRKSRVQTAGNEYLDCRNVDPSRDISDDECCRTSPSVGRSRCATVVSTSVNAVSYF